MDTRTLMEESVELLNRQMDDTIAVREHATRERWLALRSDNLALPPVFERAAAHLQASVDRVADRVITLDGIPLGGPTVIMPSVVAAAAPPQQANRMLRMLVRLLRATRMRRDVARAMGDDDSANLLAQSGRSLELLIWQVDCHAQGQD